MEQWIKVGVAIIFALVLVRVALVVGNADDYSIGINGVIETRCIGGYLYTIGEQGRPVQTLSELGKGVQCTK